MRFKKGLVGGVLVFLTIFICVEVLNAQSITVTSPATGVSWYKGASNEINWTSTGRMVASVRIELFDQTASIKILDIIGSTPNNGSYLWTIPDSVTEGSYRIKVETIDNRVRNFSAVFRIRPAVRSLPPQARMKTLDDTPQIEIIQPSGRTRRPSGAFLALNKMRCSFTVRGGERGPFKIYLYTSESGIRRCYLGSVSQIPEYPEKASAITGRYVVVMNNCSPGFRLGSIASGVLEGWYKIEVVSEGTGAKAYSADSFKLEAPSITVTTDLDGTSFDVPPDKSIRVTWNLNIDHDVLSNVPRLIDKLIIELVQEGGGRERLYESYRPPSNVSGTWRGTLPPTNPREGAYWDMSNMARGQSPSYPPGRYYIEVLTEGYIGLWGRSTGTFQINQ